MGIFFIHSVSDATVSVLFLPKLPANHLTNHHEPVVVCGPQFQKHWSTPIISTQAKLGDT
jgi:hypothetical protein